MAKLIKILSITILLNSLQLFCMDSKDPKNNYEINQSPNNSETAKTGLIQRNQSEPLIKNGSATANRHKITYPNRIVCQPMAAEQRSRNNSQAQSNQTNIDDDESWNETSSCMACIITVCLPMTILCCCEIIKAKKD